MSDAMLRLSGVCKSFHQGDSTLEILRDVDLQIAPGELVALVGPSGAGKSTLLHIAGLLERPDRGIISIRGQEAQKMNDSERTRLRREAIGFVYQYHHLLPEFSAMENLVVPQLIAGVPKKEAISRSKQLLSFVGLAAREDHRPARLSGGEQQRVAIARALVNTPGLLLADEPTGNLDPETSDGVFELLVKLVRGVGLAAFIATHNMDLARRMDRVLRLEDGHVVSN